MESITLRWWRASYPQPVPARAAEDKTKLFTSDGKETFGVLVGFLDNCKVLLAFKGNLPQRSTNKGG